MCLQVYILSTELFTLMHSSRATIYASRDNKFVYDVSKLFNLKIQSSLVLDGKYSEILKCLKSVKCKV